jgi:hypothetical protein
MQMKIICAFIKANDAAHGDGVNEMKKFVALVGRVNTNWGFEWNDP